MINALGLVLVEQSNCILPNTHQPLSGWAPGALQRDSPCLEPLPSVPSMSPQSSFHNRGLLLAPKGDPYICLIHSFIEQQEEVLSLPLCRGSGGGCEVALSLTPVPGDCQPSRGRMDVMAHLTSVLAPGFHSLRLSHHLDCVHLLADQSQRMGPMFLVGKRREGAALWSREPSSLHLPPEFDQHLHMGTHGSQAIVLMDHTCPQHRNNF